MRRALYYIPGATFGGAHNQLLASREILNKLSIDPLCILPDEPGGACERLEAAGIEVVRLPLNRLRRRRPIGSLFRFVTGLPAQLKLCTDLIDEVDTAFVQVQGLLSWDMAIAARRKKIPILWQLIDTRPPHGLRCILTPIVLRWADQIMVTGDRVAQMYPGVSTSPKTRSFLPPPSLDTQKLEHYRRGGEGIVGALGNINPQKGFEVLIAAFQEISERCPESKLKIRGAIDHGNLKYRDELLAVLYQAGLPSSTIAPLDTSVEEFLASLDVFVLPSVGRSEGIPTVVMEAIEAGVPVVVTRVGAVEEIVEDGVSGWVVPPGDPSALAAAVVSALADRKEARCRSVRAEAALMELSGLKGFRRVFQRAYEKYAPS